MIFFIAFNLYVIQKCKKVKLLSNITLAKTALIPRKDMFKIGCYFIVQAPFINLRNIWEDTDRSIIFLTKL